MRRFVVLGVVFLSQWAWSLDVDVTSDDVESALATTEQMPGFMPLYWDREEGRLYADIHAIEGPFIYYNGL